MSPSARTLRALSLMLALPLALAACSAKKADERRGATENAASSGATAASALTLSDLKVGTGAEAAAGNTVTVHYLVSNSDGTKIAATRDSGNTRSFKLGSKLVIPGLSQGITGMKESGVRKMVIPAGLAYGSKNVGAVVAANSSLIFEVELLKVAK